MSNVLSAFSKSSVSNLTWTVVDGVSAGLMGMGINWLQGKLANDGRDKDLRFYYAEENGGKIINVIARKVANDVMFAAKDFLVYEYQQMLKTKMVKDKRQSNLVRQELIRQNQVRDAEQYGYIDLTDENGVNNGSRIVAYDDWGNVCVDSLMMAIPTKEDVEYKTNRWGQTGNVAYDEAFRSGSKTFGSFGESKYENTGGAPVRGRKLVWYDTTALLNVSSERNVLLTKVQGRDYTRKELVGNGDVRFSVSGHICSNLPEVYPREEVQKFIQIVNYKGVVEVNNPIINQFGIKKVVILNYSLPSREGFKSQQDYSFEAVGIQPDKEISVLQDTITIINQEINKEDTSSAWSKLLKTKLDNLKGVSVDAVSQGLAIGTGYLDSLF